MRNARLTVLAFFLAASGCERNKTPPPAAAPVAAAAGSSTAADAAPSHPRVCEVEITGHVRMPKGQEKAPPPLTFVAVGDCLAPSAKVLGFGGTTSGAFFVEVFAPWGSDLTLCAASEASPGGESRLYGKSPLVMHAEKTGEVAWKDVVVELAPGPPRTFPHAAGAR